MEISFIASSVRPHLWDSCLTSLKNNSLRFEVVFAGNIPEETYKPYEEKYPFFRYIKTGNIKPSQCYEVARRNSKATYIMWIADDCEFEKDCVLKLVGEAKKYPFSILSVKTNENSKNNDLNDHRFFERNYNTPLMAPLGLMSRYFLNSLRGFDSRYVCGQYENDVCMRVLTKGGQVIKFEDTCVHIEHIKKHGKETKFWTGYKQDREVLENTWVIGGYKDPEKPLVVFAPSASVQMKPFLPITNREVSKTPLEQFVPYHDKDILTVSQNNKGIWE